MLSLGGVADGNAGSGDNGKGGSEDDGNIAGGPGAVAILLVLRWGTDGAVTLVFALVPSFLIFFRLATLPPPLIYLLE